MSQPARKFAKLFETEHGQVVVIRREGDVGPEIYLYAMPEGLGLCEAATVFITTDAADKSFAEFGHDKAVEAANLLLMNLTGAT